MKLNALGLAIGLAMTMNPLVSATAAEGGAQTKAEAPAASAAQPAKSKYSSATTKLGTLMEDPASRAILEKNIPGNMFNNPAAPMFHGMTLKQLQSYAPIILADDVLAKIDSEFAKIGA